MSAAKDNIEVKSVSAGKMLYILVTESYEKMGKAFDQLSEWMDQKMIKPAGPFFGIFYDTILDPEKKEIKYEVCVQVDSEIEGEDIIRYREDLVQDMVVMTYRGAYEEINSAYDAIFDWLKANNYRVVGASREVYIVRPKFGEPYDPDSLETEIQLPVMKQ